MNVLDRDRHDLVPGDASVVARFVLGAIRRTEHGRRFDGPGAGGPGRRDPLTVSLSAAQRTAVDRAIFALRRRGGVLLADRTGSGKTFLAIGLLEHALATASAERILITGPAGIAPQWIPLLRRAADAHGAHLFPVAGRRAMPARESARSAGPIVAWCSHALLSRGQWPAVIGSPDLVIVDEAHAFRNPGTRRHRALSWLCRDARVVLLTATPINNSLMDLYFLLRLFLGEGSMDDLGVPDLRAAFRAAAEARGPLRAPLDAVVDAVTVRSDRGPRSDRSPRSGRWRARSGGKPGPAMLAARRPAVVRPVAVRYDLDSTGNSVGRVLETIRHLELVPYRISRSGSGLLSPTLIRFGLVKRLESSTAAFRDSARSISHYLAAFADAAEEGFWLRPSLRRGSGDWVPDQILMAPLALPGLPEHVDPERVAASSRADAMHLRGAADLLSDSDGGMDGKTARLLELVNGALAGAKVLIFTEYRATANHLWRVLRGHRRVGLIHGSRATIGELPVHRRDVVLRFSPLSNGARVGAGEEVDVLIATDVLAEGFNLQDAADVVSYDLPWNPVRLIQRVGRIDRYGSIHDRITCYNFMPDHDLDSFLELLDRVADKLEIIRHGPGRGAAGPGLDGIGRWRPVSPFVGRTRAPLGEGLDPSIGPTGRPGRSASPARPIRPHWPDRRPARSRVIDRNLLEELANDGPGLFDVFERAGDPIAGLGVTPDPGIAGRPSRGPVERPDPESGLQPDRVVGTFWIVVFESSGEYGLLIVRPGNGSPCVVADPRAAQRLLAQWAEDSGDVRAFVTGCRAEAHHIPPAGVAAPVSRDGPLLVGASTAVCGRNVVDDPAPAATGAPAGPEVCDPVLLRAVAAGTAALAWRMEHPPAARRLRMVRAIRDLLRVLALEPGGADPDLLARADRIVARLRTGLRSGVEMAVAGVVRDHIGRGVRGRPGQADRLVSALEAVTGVRRLEEASLSGASRPPRLIAVFESGSACPSVRTAG